MPNLSKLLLGLVLSCSLSTSLGAVIPSNPTQLSRRAALETRDLYLIGKTVEEYTTTIGTVCLWKGGHLSFMSLTKTVTTTNIFVVVLSNPSDGSADAGIIHAAPPLTPGGLVVNNASLYGITEPAFEGEDPKIASTRVKWDDLEPLYQIKDHQKVDKLAEDLRVGKHASEEWKNRYYNGVEGAQTLLQGRPSQPNNDFEPDTDASDLNLEPDSEEFNPYTKPEIN